MSNNNPRTPIKPLLSCWKSISSLHGHRTLYKNRFKYLNKLKLSHPFTDFTTKSQQRTISSHLKSLTIATKYLHSIDLSAFPLHFLPLFEARKLIKRFAKSKKVSIFWQYNNIKSIMLSTFWVRHLKRLQTLQFQGPSTFAGVSPKNSAIQKFLRSLRYSKMEKFLFKSSNRSSEEIDELSDLSRYPRTLKELIFSKSCSLGQDSGLSLSRFRDLIKFQFLMSTPMEILNRIFDSVERPEKLKTLGFFMPEFQSSNTGQEDIIVKPIMEFLMKCKNLERLCIFLDMWTQILPALSEIRLKSLEFYSVLKDLDQLVQCLKGQTSLESLSIHINFMNFTDESLLSYCELFESLEGLRNLKKLRLRFRTPGFVKNLAGKVVPVVPALISAINQFEGLEELSFINLEGNFKDSLEEFLLALQKKSRTLKKIELDLNSCILDGEGARLLTQTLNQLELLEEVSLKRFKVSDDRFFEWFSDFMENNKKLRVVEIDNIERVILIYNPQRLLDMLRRALGKRELRRFSYLETWKFGLHEPFKNVKKLNPREIIKKDTNLEYLNIPSYLYNFEATTFDINAYKWS